MMSSAICNLGNVYYFCTVLIVDKYNMDRQCQRTYTIFKEKSTRSIEHKVIPIHFLLSSEFNKIPNLCHK